MKNASQILTHNELLKLNMISNSALQLTAGYQPQQKVKTKIPMQATMKVCQQSCANQRTQQDDIQKISDTEYCGTL